VTAATNLSIAANIEAIRERMDRACQRAGRAPADITLIGVSKTIEPERVAAAVEAGISELGENRVQEGTAKKAALAEMGLHPHWHLIGHLQTNKARAALEAFTTIHSIDSTKLLDAIATRALERIEVFIEVNVSGEATKEGIAPSELTAIVEHASALDHIVVRGLMTVAPLGATDGELHGHFAALRNLADRHRLSSLSMGMTNDFEIAIEEGATHIRVGRAIFGERG
jgi:hypothetical protein